MKIDRVILVSNNDKTYYDFWNPLSEVYSKKFNIKPTLVWLGSEEDKKSCNLSEEYGNIMVVEPNGDYPLPSQCPWALFWATQFYPDDTIFLCGIDEVPLSGLFISDLIKEYDEDDYLMLISDAYLPEHWSIDGSTSPSGQHISKGFNFLDIYNFEKSFKDEVDKVFKSGAHEKHIKRKPDGYWPTILDTPYWGVDECYFSDVLRNYNGNVKIKGLSHFDFMKERRIDCFRTQEPGYDYEKLQNGWYSQSHLCRPFDDHKNYILKLLNEIPTIK